MVRQNTGKKAARVAALREESTGGGAGSAPAPSAPLELSRDCPADEAVKLIARALRARRPDLGEDAGEEAGAPYLAASLLAYAADKQPSTDRDWQRVLSEVLSDAGTALDDDDDEDAVRWVIGELCRRRLLVAAAPRIEEGAVVLALLAEDDDWHEAFVQRAVSEHVFQVVFLEYGKPQATPAANIRPMEAVVDDEGAEESMREGKCEMCGRQTLLTFHHLIPKDAHPTYLKKRLPPGVDGEPTRGFLNSYGTMVCRQCHAFVHRLAPNDVLAKEYNTLEKLMEQPSVKRWVEWAGQQHRSIY